MRKWYRVVLQFRAKVIFLYFFRTHPWSKSYHTYKNTNSAWWLERPVMPCFLGMPPTLYRFKHIMVINIIISLQVRPTFQHRNQPWLLAWILKKKHNCKENFRVWTRHDASTGRNWNRSNLTKSVWPNICKDPNIRISVRSSMSFSIF